MILAIDTSTASGSIALGMQNKEIAFEKSFETGREKGGTIFGILKEIRNQFDLLKLNTIIVGLGPGSYSGVRLAIASASGLAIASNAKLIGRASALGFPSAQIDYQVIGDARRGMFYYTLVSQNECKAGPQLLDETKLRAQLEMHPGLPVYSSDDLKLANIIVVKAYPNCAEFLKKHDAANASEVPKTQVLEPIYLRPAIGAIQ